MMIEKLTSGVITVGHGRGFVVEGAGGRLVITAAHCLSFLPPALSSLGLDARVFGPLLAPRGEAPRACATCRFVDPIANIAVLGSPDASQADDYKELVSTATALPIGDCDRHPVNFWAPARLLSSDGRWVSCTIRHVGGPLWIARMGIPKTPALTMSRLPAGAATRVAPLAHYRRTPRLKAV